MINGKRTSIGQDLHHLDVDKYISSDPEENTRRRTLKLNKKDNSWGFTLQVYSSFFPLNVTILFTVRIKHIVTFI